MVKIGLQIKAGTMEHVQKLYTCHPNYQWFLKMKCSNCGEVSDKWQSVTESEKVPCKHNRSETNYLVKCKLCSRENSMDILDGSNGVYTEGDCRKFKTIVIFECRGVEPVEFSPREGWIAEVQDNGSKYENIDMTDKEWADYDEKIEAPVIPDDVMPKYICAECNLKLENAYQFMKLTQESDNILRERHGLLKNEYPNLNGSKEVMGINLSMSMKNIIQYDYKADDFNDSLSESIEIKLEPDLDTSTVKSTHKSKNIRNINAPKENMKIKKQSKKSTKKSKMYKSNIQESKKMLNEKLKLQDVGLKIENNIDEMNIFGPIWIDVQNEKPHILNENSAIENDLSSDENYQVFAKKNNTFSKRKKGDLKKSYECTVCNHIFKHRHSYDKHMRIDHKMEGYSRAKDCMCDVCGNTFHDQYGLRMHKRSHSGDRPFTCSVCGQGFTQQSNMERHISARHNKDKPFQCELCSKRFAYSSSLREHTRVHGGVQNHECGICLRRFSRRYALARHQLTHTHARPYACKHCGRTYTQTNDLKAHVKKMHVNAPTDKLTDYCIKQEKEKKII